MGANRGRKAVSKVEKESHSHLKTGRCSGAGNVQGIPKKKPVHALDLCGNGFVMGNVQIRFIGRNFCDSMIAREGVVELIKGRYERIVISELKVEKKKYVPCVYSALCRRCVNKCKLALKKTCSTFVPVR